jgi:hypothetical protein
MDNYSYVFADTLALYESCVVPGDQGDAGKGQVLVRAGYTINQTLNPRVGYVSKNPGQTQFHGVGVDALHDCGDGTGADFLTDELQADGTRLIKVAYTPYPPPPPGTPPPLNWIQPTAAYLEYPGPLVLKGTAPPELPDDGKPDMYPDDAPWPPPPILPTWAESGVALYDYEWYAQMAENVEAIYLNLLYRWSDFKGAANWLKNIREDDMMPDEMVNAIKVSDEYMGLHPDE